MSRDPALLHPNVRELMLRHQAEVLRRLGLITVCIETFREAGDQEAAFAAKLTEKRAGASHHNLTLPDGRPAACAYHLGIKLADGSILGLGTSPLRPRGTRVVPVDTGPHGVKPLSPEELLYFAVGLVGEELGLGAGMRYDVRGRGPDWQHFQLAAPLSHIVAALQAGRDLAAGLRA